MREKRLSQELLEWYDRHARAMPWRVPPARSKAGVRPDPYHIWMSEVMLQQTTVAAVKTYFESFTSRWPTVQDLAGAQDSDVMAAWAGLGYYARARNLLKCARIVADTHGGKFPGTYDELIELPGIGPYTAAAISAIAFGQASTVVDGNVERVMVRLRAVDRPIREVKDIIHAHAAALTPDARAGDYAQGVMDLGATICTPKSPACGICPWREPCAARAAGIAADLPVKAPKAVKPTRRGTAFVARRADGAWLLEQRPGKGLLGGMLGWPGSGWAEVAPETEPPIDGQWEPVGAEVRHTFTHFHLVLDVMVAQAPLETDPGTGRFWSSPDFKRTDLPTVMRKAYDLAARHPLFH